MGEAAGSMEHYSENHSVEEMLALGLVLVQVKSQNGLKNINLVKQIFDFLKDQINVSASIYHITFFLS